jgi:hypothetical protein
MEFLEQMRALIVSTYVGHSVHQNINKDGERGGLITNNEKF